ncbi:hypothetical protein [Streptomyces lydicus]|uniref:hypothetical protein n=1 Tax=Streptomyces lydicus TaxID=47763 RepID=UPI0010106681|nr:hypothetical protein [Streptomyces lydicus]MCZ1008617.1 hypothetical protein [Streptomyces lydicus]
MPLLSVTAIVCFFASVSLSNGHRAFQSRACRYTLLPWTNFAVSYGGLIAAVLAVTIHLLMFRSARRAGHDPHRGWQSMVATLFVAIAWLMVLLTAGMVVVTHMDAAEAAADIGKRACEG